MTPKEALDWVENIFEEHHVQLPDVELTLIRQALNELERLKKFKQTFDSYELAKKQDFIAYENWIECEKEIEKLESKVETLESYIRSLEERLMIGEKL